MTLDEAIKQCDKIADYDCYNEEQMKRAEEYRQLAEWLKELKRAKELLEATYELLEKQKNNPYVLNLLSETIFYDEAECDGNCLMEDIENLLEFGL